MNLVGMKFITATENDLQSVFLTWYLVFSCVSLSLSNDNIAFKEAQGTALDLESSGRALNMGDGESIAAGEVLLERKFNGFWKHGSMFRPSIVSRPPSALWPSSSSAEDISSQVTSSYGFKACFRDYQTPTSPPLACQNYVSQFCLVDQSDLFCNTTFQVASHKAFLCIKVYIDLENGFRSPQLIVCNLLEERVRVLPLPEYNVNLIHMRVDDSGDYKLLIAGSYNSQHLSRCTTEEYDSKTDTWEHVTENPNFPGSFKEFRNGTFYKNPEYDQERLFCISTNLDAVESQGVLMYDFKGKTWSRCEVPHVTVDQGSHVQPVGPLSIEDYGRIIFLFSEHKCGDHVYIFIHKLNLDVAGNIKWEEVIRKERSADGQPGTFLVYPCVPNCAPSADVIAGAGGCIFAFSMKKCGEVLCIHELDSPTLTWGPAILFRTPKQFPLRSSNWTVGEKHGSLLLHLEALNASVACQGPPWAFISQGLWEWAALDRSPKSCQGQWDTLLELYKKDFDQPKSTGSANFDLGLNQICYGLMEKIFALKKKIKDTSQQKLAKALPGPSRKRVRSAEQLLGSAYEASGARGRSSSIAALWAPTIELQPSAPESVATVTPFVASTSQPAAADADGPSSSMALPLIPASTSTQVRQPSDYGGPSTSTAHRQCSETNVGLASTSVGELFPALSWARPSDAPTVDLSHNLEKGESEHGRTLGKCVQRKPDYQRAMHALRWHNHELTDAQKRELLTKTTQLGLRKAQHRNTDLQSGDIISNFSVLIDVLQSSVGSGYTSCECFKLLMETLETDILELR